MSRRQGRYHLPQIQVRTINLVDPDGSASGAMSIKAIQVGELRLRFRVAGVEDLDRLVEIGDDALGDDFIMDNYFYPRRHRYPLAFHNACVRSLKCDLQTALTWIICADVETSASQSNNIDKSQGTNQGGAFETVGWAVWSRETSAEEQRGAQRSVKYMGLPDSYELLPPTDKCKLWAYNLSISEFYRGLRNPAASLSHLVAVRRDSKDEYLDSNWKDPLAYWPLQQLNVLKRYQRKGIGQTLVNWGLGFARRERLPAMLISTPEGRRLYDKSGFVQYGSWRWKKDEAWAQMIWYSDHDSVARSVDNIDDGAMTQALSE